MAMKRKTKSNILKAVLVVGLGLVIVLGIVGSNIVPNISSTPSVADNSSSTQPASDAPVPCGDAAQPVPQAYRIYPHLSIIVNDSAVAVPSGIGVAPNCDRVIYTNDNSGTIRVEPNAPRAYTLGNFFSVWGQPFSPSQILSFKADDSHAILVTVNGVQSSDFQNLVLQDKQQIVITYEHAAKAPSATSGKSSSTPFTVTIP